MGIRILGGIRINEDPDRVGSVLYDSTSNDAFGPVFEDTESAEAFLEWFWSKYGDNCNSRFYLIRSARLIHDNEYLPYLRAKQKAHEMLEEVLADRMVGLLNELLELDYEATTRLVFGEYIPCNKAFAEHPSVQVREVSLGKYGVRTMGLLNGLAGIYPDGYGRIGGEFEWRCSKHGLRAQEGRCGSERLGTGEMCQELVQPRLLRFSRVPADKHQVLPVPPVETVQ